jgi:hypothetical protein
LPSFKALLVSKAPFAPLYQASDTDFLYNSGYDPLPRTISQTDS